jgi:hypothetical protein
MTNGQTYDANVRVRELPRKSDRIINTIAARRGVNKWEVIRDAIVEYAEKHENDTETVGDGKR